MTAETNPLVAHMEFPEALYYDIPHQMWVRYDADTGLATIGITALGIHLSGDIYMCRPKRVGTALQPSDSLGVVELAKSVVSFKSPIAGTVEVVNPVLEEYPERVHQHCYSQGWLVQMRPSHWPQPETGLLQGRDAVLPAMQHHAWLNRAE